MITSKPRLVGIDLGTTNICAAMVRGRTPRMMELDQGKTALPAVINVSGGGKYVIGAAARDLLVTDPKNTIYGSKRLIGRQFNSLVVEELRHYFPYEIVEGDAGCAAVRLNGETLSLTDLSARILAHVKAQVERSAGETVPEAIISVPAYYNDNQRQAVKEAGARAGFTVRRIVNEPTAAALAFGFNRAFNEKVLIYDLGGGTFDVSVLQIAGNVFEVVATGGDSFLGGVDLDNRVIDYVLSDIRHAHKADLADDPVAMQRIKNAAEAAKIDLSLIPNAVISLPCLFEKKGRPVDVTIPLSRECLNDLTSDIIGKTFDICRKVMESNRLNTGDIDEVILVGGQSRMPLVQQLIERNFGKPPRKGVHPDECVAIGSALLGEALGSSGSVTLIDVLSMPIGIALSNGSFRKIIDKNSTVPVSMTFRLPTPKSPDACFLSLDIFQGDNEMVVDNEFLGTLRVPVAAAGRKVEFRLNTEALLEVVVEMPDGPQRIELTTCDTPLILRKALDEERQRRESQATEEELSRSAAERPGFLNSIMRLFGRS